MDDIQVVESKPLIADKELPVCALCSAKSNSEQSSVKPLRQTSDKELV